MKYWWLALIAATLTGAMAFAQQDQEQDYAEQVEAAESEAAQEAEPPAQEEEAPAESAVEVAAPSPAAPSPATPSVEAAVYGVTAEEAGAISPNYRSPMPPPGPLLRVDGHWSPYLIPEVPEGASVHIIQPGDTLWDLSAKYAGDAYLWPQIWQHNLYITDPHWIYPGDPVFLRPIIVLTDEVIADAARDLEIEEEEEAPVEPETRIAEAPAKSESPKMILDMGRTGPQPAATFDEMYCSYFVNPEGKPSYDIKVVSLQNIEAEIGAEGDVVFLNRGYEHGLSAGQEFAVFRAGDAVRHPNTRRSLGVAVYRVGKVRVLSVQPKTAMGFVAQSCREIKPGDGLMPWKEIPIPLYLDKPLDFVNYAPSGKTGGHIVHAKDDIQLVGERHIVTVDLGENQGVGPGDFITIFQENPAGPDFQRYLVAEMIVLLAQDNTATCKVMRAITEASIGSTVEAK